MSAEPEPLSGPCAWRGEELQHDPRWQYQFDDRDIAELDAALRAANQRGPDADPFDPEGFPLPRLARKLQAIGDELEFGCGIVRVRGLPVKRWSRAELETVWMGIAGFLGRPVYQNAHGQRLREIRDEGSDVGARYGQLHTESGTFLSSRARTASTAALRFHTDRCDVVGLLCVNDALRGGLSRIASSVTVHNTMLARRPDLAALLYENLPRSRIGEEVGGENAWYALPVWGVRDGKFTSHYSRTYVEAGQLQDGVPKVSDTHWEALDLLAELAEESCLQMTLRPGDIQFLNNHVVYHARTAFEDAPAQNKQRTLLRVWLCAPERALPPGHEVLWGEIESGALRGGIGQEAASNGHG